MQPYALCNRLALSLKAVPSSLYLCPAPGLEAILAVAGMKLRLAHWCPSSGTKTLPGVLIGSYIQRVTYVLLWDLKLMRFFGKK